MSAKNTSLQTTDTSKQQKEKKKQKNTKGDRKSFHHGTVQSRVSKNQPMIMKYQRELKKVLMELRQKDEDYRYAIEIGESLDKENKHLKEELQTHKELVSELRNTLQSKQQELSRQKETHQREKHVSNGNMNKNKNREIQRQKKTIERISGQLEQFLDIKDSMNNFQQMIDSNKQQINSLNEQIVAMTENEDNSEAIADTEMSEYNLEGLKLKIERLMRLNNHLTIKNDILNQFIENNKIELMLKEVHNTYIKNIQNESNNRNHQRVTSETASEKQLHIQLDKQKQKTMDKQQTIEHLTKKLDDMNELKQKYEALKKANKGLKQITKDELWQHIQMQKSIEAEAIYLAAKKANMEEEREELLNLLEQRDYEITMLNQQLALQRQANQNMESTLGDDIGSDESDEYYDYNDGMNSEDEDQMLDDKDEIDLIAGILDDEDLFDDDNDIEGQVQQTKHDMNNNNKDITEKKTPNSRKEISEESRDKKAFDKIKEYLHLTASAVKIKYPTVKDIQSDELIKKVKELPFYKYHDQMVRIMETQIREEKKKTDKSNNNNQQMHTHNTATDDLDSGPPPGLSKRKSFLSIFNIFGGVDDKSNDDSDNENDMDNKSDGGHSDNDNNDTGISTVRRRRGSKRRKKKSFKKKKHRKKSLTIENDNEKGNDTPAGVSRYKRGSVHAEATRLKK